MNGTDEESVLIRALPPATDYLTYLTILEYNLSKRELPLLHDLLQDEKLVSNIGWDLVHVLLPLLPESRQCLEDVASLGNPREVILKVTEELDQLQLKAAETLVEESEEDEDDDGDARAVAVHAGKPKSRQLQANPRDVVAFETLMQMLCMLHPRIKAKKPSRFLETSVTATLGAYQRLAESQEATRAVLMFLKTMSGSTRPSLPPRSGELPIPSVASHTAALDPEANSDGIADGEESAMAHLLRVMVSHVILMHLDTLYAPTGGMGWTQRFVEAEYPDRVLSERKTAGLSPFDKEHLRQMDVIVNQILVSPAVPNSVFCDY